MIDPIQCRRCGRTLTNEASKKYGIGPICLQKEREEAGARETAAISRPHVDVGPLEAPLLTVHVKAPPPVRSDC